MQGNIGFILQLIDDLKTVIDNFQNSRPIEKLFIEKNDELIFASLTFKITPIWTFAHVQSELIHTCRDS